MVVPVNVIVLFAYFATPSVHVRGNNIFDFTFQYIAYSIHIITFASILIAGIQSGIRFPLF